jgi:hypothetical protein
MFGYMILGSGLFLELVLEQGVLTIQGLGLGVHDLFVFNGVDHVLVLSGFDFLNLLLVF